MSINPAFGLFVADRLKQARTANGGQLLWTAVAGIIQLAYEEEAKQFTAGSSPPTQSTAKKALSMVGMPDEQWLAELESNPAYEGIDVKRELGKCQTWMRLRGRQATRRSFLNWLNKAEKTIGYNGVGRSSATPNTPELNPYQAPDNWQMRARLLYGEVELPDTWSELGLQIRKEILKKTHTTQ